MKLRIGQKGLLIVAIPLAFQLIFMGVFMSTVMDDLKKIQEEEHAKAVLTCLNKIRRYTEEGVMSLARYKSSHDERDMENYEKLIERSPGEISTLKKVVSRHPDEFKLALRIEHESTKAMAVLSECKETFSRDNQFVAFADMPRLFKSGMQVKQAVDQLADKYMAIDAHAAAEQKQRIERLLGYLLLGIAANIIITIFLGRFFMSSISGRLESLRENSQRLSRGETLLPELSGADEIKALDLSFRAMASALSSAQEEQRALTQTALLSEERTRSVIENMPIGLLLVDERNQIESLNPRAEQMFLWSNEDARAHNLLELLPDNPVNKTLKTTNEFKLKDLQSTLAAKPGDSSAQRSDGSVFPAEVAISKFSTGEGKHYLVAVQDVSERHEMERLKQEFVSMVSHDLRTPLTAVLGTLELFDEETYGQITEQGHKRLKVACQSVDRLITLINDLLDIEKLEAGKMRIEQEPCSLNEILYSSVESVRTFAENAGVRLLIEDNEDFKVNADKDRIIQVVINLLSNSVKFSPEGKSVTINTSKNHSQALVKVIDEGRGIPEEHQKSLFERFKQVKASDGARKKGTGLGLAICKAIIESHGGEIGVISQEGKGSCFHFSIPLAE